MREEREKTTIDFLEEVISDKRQALSAKEAKIEEIKADIEAINAEIESFSFVVSSLKEDFNRYGEAEKPVVKNVARHSLISGIGNVKGDFPFKSFKECINAFIADSAITQKTCARLLHRSVASISKWMSGESIPNRSEWDVISNNIASLSGNTIRSYYVRDSLEKSYRNNDGRHKNAHR